MQSKVIITCEYVSQKRIGEQLSQEMKDLNYQYATVEASNKKLLKQLKILKKQNQFRNLEIDQLRKQKNLL